MNTSATSPAGALQDYLSSDELKSLQVFTPLRVLVDTAAIWAVILAMLACSAISGHPAVIAATFVTIASRQLALTHLVHDASHYRLFTSRRFNDLFSDLLLAGPVAISTGSYRAQHLPHHQFLGDRERDTDQRSWYAIKGSLFWKRTLLTLLGWEAVVTFGSYAQAGTGDGKPGGIVWRLCCAALANGLLLMYLWWLGQPLFYILLWILPLFTLTMLLQNYRVIAEHQPEDYAARGVDRAPESFTPPLTRTLTPGPLGKFLLGPCNFHYHHEHHLSASVPYHQLPKMHAWLRQRGYYANRPEALGGGYADILLRLVKPRPMETTVDDR